MPAKAAPPAPAQGSLGPSAASPAAASFSLQGHQTRHLVVTSPGGFWQIPGLGAPPFPTHIHPWVDDLGYGDDFLFF